MNEGEKAGWFAVVFLLLVGAAAYFTIFMVIFSLIKKLI